MTTPIGLNLHFAASFSVEYGATGAGEITEIAHLVRRWLIHRKNVPANALDGWFYDGGRWEHARRAIEVASFEAGENVELWACRLEHECHELRFRRWRTDVGVERLGPRSFRVSIETFHWLLPQFLGEEPTRPIPTAPGVAHLIIGSSKWRASSGTEELRCVASTPMTGEGRSLAKRVSNQDRSCPLIVITLDKRLHGMEEGFKKLAHLLTGAASVYLLADDEVIEEYNWHLPEPFRVRPGMIRIYHPRVAITNASDARRHRYLTRAEIEEKGWQGIQEILVRSIARRFRHGSLHVSSVDEIHRRHREVQRENLRHQATIDHDFGSEWVRLLEEDNRALTEEKELLKREIARLQEFEDAAELLQDVSAENERLARENKVIVANRDHFRSELEGLRRENEQLKAQARSFHELRRRPTSLAEVLDCLAGLHGDRIIVLDEARRSAKDSTFSEIDTAWEIIWSIAEDLHGLLFAGDLSVGEIEDRFQASTGFEVSFTESAQTKANKRMMRSRRVEYHGEQLEIVPHVKYGSRPPKCLRVHFAKSTAERRIIIGFCGDHMETFGTQRLS